MKTSAELLNEKFACDLFAVRCDEHGLPVDGWALPTLTVEDDKRERKVHVSIGTFRIRGGALERRLVSTTMSLLRFRDKTHDSLKTDMLARLVSELDRKGGAK